MIHSTYASYVYIECIINITYKSLIHMWYDWFICVQHTWKCRALLRKCSPLLQNYRALCVSPTHRHVYAIHTWFLSNNTLYASTQMNMYMYITIYSEENKSIRFREKSICKRPLSPKISFLSRVLDLPFKTHGSFLRCVQLQRARLAPCCTTHARSE